MSSDTNQLSWNDKNIGMILFCVCMGILIVVAVGNTSYVNAREIQMAKMFHWEDCIQLKPYYDIFKDDIFYYKLNTVLQERMLELQCT